MPLKKVKLTLSLTVSLIFELALLTAEYKNDPKFFAPCVTFVVTKRKEKIKIRVRKKYVTICNEMPEIKYILIKYQIYGVHSKNVLPFIVVLKRRFVNNKWL